eukprot:tig00000849_g4759.t1
MGGKESKERSRGGASEPALPTSSRATPPSAQPSYPSGPAAQQPASQPTSMQPGVFRNAQYAGVAGLQRAGEARDAQTDQTLQSAFSGDIKALMQRAKELVDLAERFKASAQPTSAEDDDFRSVATQLGLRLPGRAVTKEHAGSAFHDELARELCALLEPHVARAGGMLALQEAYCLANRARGTALISPEDLLGACAALAPLALPLRLRSFDSGARVLADVRRSDAALAEDVRRLAAARGPLTVVSLAAGMGVGAPLAGEYARIAEAAGALARDESGLDVFYYANEYF